MEKMIRRVYRLWKKKQIPSSPHPDLESIACFIDGLLKGRKRALVTRHLLACDECSAYVAMHLNAAQDLPQEAPVALRRRAQGLVADDAHSQFEITAVLREKMLELLHTSGRVMAGRSLMSRAALRSVPSQAPREYKDELIIERDGKDVKVRVKIECPAENVFDLIVSVKDKTKKKTLKGLRVSVYRGGIELESYALLKGKALFEHIPLGKYTIVIERLNRRIASVKLDMRA